MKWAWILLILPSLAYSAPTVHRKGRNFTEYTDASWPANRRQATITIHDQNYQDENGQWQTVVEDFETDGADGFDMKADKMNHKIRVNSSTARRWYPRRNVNEYVDIGEVEYWASNKWSKVAPGGMNHFLQKLYWENSAIRVELIPLWDRMKFNAILKTNQAPTRMRVLNTYMGLTENNGQLTSSSDGNVVGFLVMPTAVDASSTTVPVTTSTYSGYFEMNVNTSGKTFPIIVDPTYSVQPDNSTGMDVYLDSTAPDTNRDSASGLYVDSNGTYRCLIKFPITGLEGGTCTSSTMTLMSGNTSSSQVQSVYSLASGVSTWSETQATWNSYKTGSAWPGSSGANTAGTDYETGAIGSVAHSGLGSTDIFPLTASRVTGMMNGTNYGMLIVAGGTTLIKWQECEYGIAGSRPKLDITYDLASAGSRFKSQGVYRLKGGVTIK
jgi:hypothetical protein